jgi:hypothetical protein
MTQNSTNSRNLVLAGIGTAACLFMMSLIVSSANAKDKEIPPTMGGSQKGTTAQGPAGSPKKKAVNPTTLCKGKPCPKKGT